MTINNKQKKRTSLNKSTTDKPASSRLDIIKDKLKSRSLKQSLGKHQSQRPKRTPKQRLWVYFKRTVFLLFVTGSTAVIAVGGYISWRIATNLQSVQAISSSELEQNPNSEIYASDGTTLIWTDTDYQHKPLSKEDTPEILKELLIATEDKTFEDNDGYSMEGTANMVLTSVKYYIQKIGSKIPIVNSVIHAPTDDPRGGSTITQQLVKNIRYKDTNLDVVDRKIQEMALAIRLTDDCDKDDIIQAYLNKVGFLESSYGFNTAYFLLYGDTISADKTDPVSIARYATIVGMLKNPTIYNPRSNPDASLNRRNTVLHNAYEDGYLSKSDYEAACAVAIDDGLRDQGWFTQQVYETSSANGSYVNSIIDQLEDYGYELDNSNYPITVISNLNISENEWLQSEVAKSDYYVNERQEVAVTVVDPSTSNVLAQVGSRNGASATDLNRAVQTTRSSGSVIKPFLDYAPLIEFAGYDTTSVFNADTTSYAGTDVTVRNYGGYTYGNVTMQRALQLSLNVPAVTALQYQEPWMNQTIMNNLSLANHVYDDNWNLVEKTEYGGSDALGINESTQAFAGAFAALANYGTYTEPRYIDKIIQNGSETSFQTKSQQAMSPRTAYKLLSMLETTTQTGASAASAAIPNYAGYAVKTGTVGMDDAQPIYYDTDHNEYAGTAGQVAGDLVATDSWMAGTTKSASIAVWTGFDDQAIYGDWIDSNNQTRSDIFTSVMQHFNTNKDTSQWAASNEIVDLQTTATSQDTLSISDTAALSALTNSATKTQTVTKNTTKATSEQITLYNNFLNNTLGSPYENIKSYMEANDPYSYALYKIGLSGSTLYTVSKDGTVVSE